MSLFFQIFRLQFLQFTRSFFGGGRRRKVYLVFILIFPVSIFMSSKNLFLAWLSLGETGDRLFANMISTSLLGLLVFLSIGGVPFILHSLGKSGDLRFLLSAPVPARMIFLAKALISGFYNSTLLFMIILPMLVASAWVHNASILVYPFVLLILVVYIQIPTFVSTLLSALFLRLTSLTRARNLATALMGILFLGGWIAFQFLRLEQLDPTAGDFDPLRTSQFAQLHLWHVLPSQLFADLLVHLVKGELISTLLLFLSCLAIAAAALTLGVILLEYLNRSEQGVGRSTGSKFFGRKNSMTAGSGGSIYLALVEKDLRLLWRDSRLATSFLMLFVMIIVFPLIFAGSESSDPFQILFLSLFLAAIVANVTSRLFPFEGKAFRLNLISPQPLHLILVAKLILASAMILLPTALTFLVLMLKLKPGFLTAVSIALMLGGAAVIGMSSGLAFGIRFANFKYVNPRYMLLPPGHLLLPLVTAATAVFGLALYYVGSEWLSPTAAAMFWLLYVGLVSVTGFRYALNYCKKLEWYF